MQNIFCGPLDKLRAVKNIGTCYLLSFQCEKITQSETRMELGSREGILTNVYENLYKPERKI